MHTMRAEIIPDRDPDVNVLAKNRLVVLLLCSHEQLSSYYVNALTVLHRDERLVAELTGPRSQYRPAGPDASASPPNSLLLSHGMID